MSIEHVLAVVPVSDLQVSSRWYEALFGRPADNNPMPTLAEWQVVPGAWVQIFTDGTRAGSGIAGTSPSTTCRHMWQAFGSADSSPVTSPAPARRAPIGNHRSRRQHDQPDRRIPGPVLIRPRQWSAAPTAPNTARVD